MFSKDVRGIQMWTGVQNTLLVTAWPLRCRCPSVQLYLRI